MVNRRDQAKTLSKVRRSQHRTQWAAQFAVASELCKRGYQVALTLGNHPAIDLMVISPGGSQFKIDVKGLYKPNEWAVSQKSPSTNLFYVFAFVPDDAPNEFFVADQSTVNQLLHRSLEHRRESRARRGTSLDKVERFPGIPWKDLLPYKSKWKETLPQ